MDLNRLILPCLAQYLDGLPQNIGSYPGAMTKSDFSLILRRQLEPFLSDAQIPATLRRVLGAPWKQGEWIPTTAYVALCAMARDCLWKSDAEYHRGMFEVAMEMYNGPVYRALFFMFGPSVLAMSAGKRWDTLHQGTKLVIKKQKKESIELVVTFPHKLFTQTAIQSLGAAFCAVAQGSRAKDPSFTLVSFGDVESEILISWTY